MYFTLFMVSFAVAFLKELNKRVEKNQTVVYKVVSTLKTEDIKANISNIKTKQKKEVLNKNNIASIAKDLAIWDKSFQELADKYNVYKSDVVLIDNAVKKVLRSRFFEQ